jgi:predicted Zn-dependent protease
MDKKSAQDVVEKVLALSDATETEVLLSANQENLTRFSDNAVSQNVSRSNVGLTVKVHLGQKVGRATTDMLDSGALERVIGLANKVASQQRDNPDLLPLPEPAEFRSSDAFVTETAEFSPEARAEAIRLVVGEADKAGGKAAGIFSTEKETLAIGNSNGLFAHHQGTSVVLSATVEVDDGSGWAEEVDKDVGNIHTAHVAEIAVKKALDSRDAQPIDPGEYTVVLEPAAVADFLMFMAWEAFGGLNYIEGRSFMSNKIGERVLGSSVTILDDAYDSFSPGIPFDFEGLPRQRVVLIKDGHAHSVVHDRITAARTGTESTGHSLPQPNSTGPLPLNLLLEPGDSSIEEMITSTQRGILVTHFHYTNVLDPVRLTLTGMTRDGTFLIEDGRVTRPVRNLRFTDSVVDVLNRIEHISAERRAVQGFFGGNFVLPALHISKFNFSSTSDF